MLWFSKIISYHFAAQKVLSIRNFPGPVSNVSCTAHTKALKKAANKLLERQLKNGKTQAYFFLLIQHEKWKTPILLMI